MEVFIDIMVCIMTAFMWWVAIGVVGSIIGLLICYVNDEEFANKDVLQMLALSIGGVIWLVVAICTGYPVIVESEWYKTRKEQRNCRKRARKEARREKYPWFYKWLDAPAWDKRDD